MVIELLAFALQLLKIRVKVTLPHFHDNVDGILMAIDFGIHHMNNMWVILFFCHGKGTQGELV